jgi:hypothetical protein
MTDWKCSNCGWANRDFAAKCLSCGADKADAVPMAAPPPTPWDLPPRTTPQNAPVPAAAAAAQLPGSDSLGRGILFAAAAAVVATLLWYLVVSISGYELGIVAALVGWVVGTAAVVGAGRHSSMFLVGVSVIFTLIALVMGEYLITYHFLTQAFGQLELIQPPWVIIEIVIEVISADPLTLLFWGIALYSAASVPYKAIGAVPQPAREPLPAPPDREMGT